MSESLKNRMFRLSDADFALLDAIATAITEASGVNVKRSDALRVSIRDKAITLGVDKQEPNKPTKRKGK